jgi:hypothetical protein
VASPEGEPGDFDPTETAELRWATLDEADRLLAQTTLQTGRLRDLSVLSTFRGWLTLEGG